MMCRLFRDNRGSVAPIFAIAAIPLVMAMGAAVDFSNLFQKRGIVQSALDSATLAANRLVGLEPLSEVQAEAQSFFDANLAGKGLPKMALDVAVSDGAVTVETDFSSKTYFLGLAGIDNLNQHLTAKSVAGAATYEVVMVLDNSGSMSGSKISSLRQAATDLTNALFEVNQSNPKPDPVKIGLVPFTAAVNVGPSQANASWIDKDGIAPTNSENFDENAKRFDLFDKIDNVSWQGCVEARPAPYDVNDETPTTATPATLFVPMFAPDEPDSGSFPNDYLDDYAGSCKQPFVCPANWSNRKCARKGGVRTAPSDADRQAQVCKYDSAHLNNNYDNGVSRGPNYNCTAKPVQPLTTNESTVLTQINNMVANGMTDIHAGVMWGWRLLSPGAPFTEGRPYDTKDNRKILIVMTDGDNTYNTYNTFNKSMYGSFGYVSMNHLGTTSSNNNTVVEKMNDRTEEACANVKATGKITVYTVAFQVNNSSTLAMLTNCASRPEMAFRSSSNSELVDTFRQIARDISLLRLDK